MSFTREDFRELRNAIRDLGKSINCVAQISVRPVCLTDGEGCSNAYAVYKTDEKGTTLVRVETIDGVPVEITEANAITACTCDCVDLISA